MRLATQRRWLMALLLALSASALSLDFVIRSSIDLELPRSLPPLFRVRRPRDLSLLRPDVLHASAARRPPLEPTDAAPSRPHASTRGLVLPLDETNAALGMSLLLNLRELGREAAAATVEVAHCGEAVPRAFRLAFQSFFPLGPVRFRDVCRRGLLPSADRRALQLRGQALRLAAVAFSELDELLLLDAAALFFHDPTLLFDDAAYRAAGALFFPSARRSSNDSVSAPAPTAGDDPHAARFDSSLAVWSKQAQRRATAELVALLADDDADLGALGGSSELLAAACERADAAFALTRFDAGVVGSIVARSPASGASDAAVSLCGALAQFAAVPAESRHRLRATLPATEPDKRPRPLFLSGRSVLDAVVSQDPPSLIVYTALAAANETLVLTADADANECAGIASPASMSAGAAVAVLSKHELERVALRRQQHQHVLDWTRSVADWSEMEARASLDDDDSDGDDSSRLADTVRDRVAALVASEEQLVYSLDQLAQRTSSERGVVLPLYDKIAVLGVSLVLELRDLGVALPVEIAHCGDLSPEFRRSFAALLNGDGDGDSDPGVRFYDVCALAAQQRSTLFPSRKLFCRDLGECHRKFRGFDIKVLALVLSRFAEVLLLDADTLFFSSPAALFDTRKYRETGTLFFRDRISGDNVFMAQRLARDARQTVFHEYMLSADVSRLAAVPTLARELGALAPRATAAADASAGSTVVVPPDPSDLPFAPSDSLLASHTWNARAGFEMDSSCVLWSKSRQPRATAALASFIARNDVRAPPSYGDKELFFVACELAETRYAFSDFGIGAVGTYVIDKGPGRSVVCGDMSHNLPEWEPDGASDHSPLLYINSDSILAFQPDQKTVFYSKPRPAEHYPGPFPWQQECPFNVTAVAFSDDQRARVYRRQRLHSDALSWLGRSVLGGAAAAV